MVAAIALAAPLVLITNNNTDEQSRAFIDGTHPSHHPVPARTTRQIYWNMVKIACFEHTSSDNKCSAVIRMATDTLKPIDIGTVSMDLETGDITPKLQSSNGYTLTVNGPGETTITKNQ